MRRQALFQIDGKRIDDFNAVMPDCTAVETSNASHQERRSSPRQTETGGPAVGKVVNKAGSENRGCRKQPK